MGTTLDKLNSVRNDLRLPSNYPYLEEIAEAAGTTVAALSRHIDDWIADYRRTARVARCSAKCRNLSGRRARSTESPGRLSHGQNTGDDMGDFWSVVAPKRSEHTRSDIAEELIERGDR